MIKNKAVGDIRKQIVIQARQFEGIREVTQNSTFDDDGTIERLLRLAGHQRGWAYCALFGEVVWTLAYQLENSLMVDDLTQYFSASAVQTFRNFKAIGLTRPAIETPEPGDLLIWQLHVNGVASWKGHLAVGIRETTNGFRTIEGNTNALGDREGDGIFKKVRQLHRYMDHGLRYIGAIKPIEL